MSNRLLAELIRNAPMAMATFDRDLRYLSHTESWLSAHGDPGGRSVVGQLHYDVFPEIPESWREVHKRCLSGATERREVDPFVRSNGVTEYLRWLIAPWREDDGEVGGILIFAENITEQVKTKRRLDEHESTIRDFFAHSPVGLNLCTLEGLWIVSNPAFLRIIGYTAEEADGGLTYWQLTPRRFDAEEAAQLELLRTTHRYGPYEKEFIRKDGTLVPVRLNGFLFERDGAQFIWSLIEDMTEQRALERKVEEERLQAIQASKLATVGEMAASFAHEINNPLGIVELYASTLKQAIDENDGVLIDEAIDSIRAAAARAGQIVRGLARFTRQSQNEAPASLTLESVVQDAMALCRPRIASRGIALEVELSPASGATVRGNRIELSQVVVNLLNNALDAARKSSTPWIRVRSEEGPEGEWVGLVVEDSGGPIPPGTRERLFRPFFTTKAAGEGTGLGLSISRTIMENHGGTLALDPDASHTRFVMRLPRDRA